MRLKTAVATVAAGVAALVPTAILITPVPAQAAVTVMRGINNGQKGTWFIFDSGISFFVADL